MAKYPVEQKVKVATFWTGAGTAVLVAVLGAISDANLVASLPDWLAVPAAAALTAALTFFNAYQARHTPRDS